MTTFFIGALTGFCFCSWLWRYHEYMTETTTHHTPRPVCTYYPPEVSEHLRRKDDRRTV